MAVNAEGAGCVRKMAAIGVGHGTVLVAADRVDGSTNSLAGARRAHIHSHRNPIGIYRVHSTPPFLEGT